MKKIFIFLFIILSISFNSFCEWKQIATTYNTKLSYDDIMEIFIEEITKSHYKNVLWHYNVFTKENEQNYAWAVYIKTDGYIGGNGEVKERSVYLHTNNGKIFFESFSSPTEWSINGITEGSANSDYLISLQRNRILATFLDESSRWLTRYGRQYSLEQLWIFDLFLRNYCGTNGVIISAKENKIDYLTLLLLNDFDINEKAIKGGNTALIEAVFAENKEMVKFLLLNHAEINKQNDEGETALFYACKFGNKEMVQILLQSSTDINIKNKYGSTALVYAVSDEPVSLEIVKLLIQAGADVNASGNLALYRACLHSSEEMIYTLFQAGAIINFPSQSLNILVDSLGNKREKAVKILIDKKKEISVAENDIQTQLIIAAYNNDVQTLKNLIYRGADINLTNIDGLTPLMLACANNSKEVFYYLLENGAVVSKKYLYYGSYKTALDFAVIYGNKEFIDIMLKLNDNIETSVIWNAFTYASERDEIEIVNLLVDFDKDDIYKDVVYRNIEVIDSLKSYYYFMTNDMNAIEYELKRYGCRLPVWNELEDDNQLSYEVRKKMMDLDCCWSLTVSGSLDVLYYYPFKKGENLKKVFLYQLTQ